MKNKFIPILMAFLFLLPGLQAVELKLTDRSITDSREYKEDYLFHGEALDFSGKVRDLFFFSESMEFSGQSELAVNGAAEYVVIEGNVGNGVKAAARYIDINGVVNGTSFLDTEIGDGKLVPVG